MAGVSFHVVGNDVRYPLDYAQANLMALAIPRMSPTILLLSCPRLYI